MNYLVETSTCISFLDEGPGWQNVEPRILDCKRGDIETAALSAVKFGISVVIGQSRRTSRKQLQALMRLWRVLPFEAGQQKRRSSCAWSPARAADWHDG